MYVYCVKDKASTTLSLDLCPDFIESVAGQPTFPFRMFQRFQPILVGNNVKKIKIKVGQLT
mgnify:FL=1